MGQFLGGTSPTGGRTISASPALALRVGLTVATTPASRHRGVLVVLYTDDLGAKLRAVEDAGGTIAKPIYGFPGGKRFHFYDPNGIELAVWSE